MDWVAEHQIECVTPHDLRRTCLTWITRLGFGRDAMDRIANHKTSTVTDVYDRHGYVDEDKRIMTTVRGT
jgi:integrase